MTPIIVAHNYYQQAGGEDRVFEAETDLLERHGHDVTRLVVHNDAVEGMSRLRLARALFWNEESYERMRALVRATGARVVHVHNTLPLLSPAVLDAAKAEGAAVVQTLHNYRLLCPKALLYRDGKVCELCLGKTFAWPGVARGCYRDDRAATAALAAMTASHRLRGTWNEQVDVFIALTEFARRKFVEGGLPEDRLVVKPNFFTGDPGVGEGAGGYALFVGRLSEEKGPDVLLDAWEIVGDRLPLKIVGDGPLADMVRERAARQPGVEWLGWRDHDAVVDLVRDARMLVLPYLSYEGTPMTLLEAYAAGLPVVGSNRGSLSSLIVHEQTGLLARAGDGAAMAEAVLRLAADADLHAELRRGARAAFEAEYTEARNYEQLLAIYDRALHASRLHATVS